MFQHLPLTRPLAVLDLEATGIDPAEDRVVEVSVLVIRPDGTKEQKTRRINPTVPIPPESTAIHKITDADVKDAPTFKRIARGLAEFLSGCDLCGYNLKSYDLRLLTAEFHRAGVPFPLEDRAVLDLIEIYHRFEKRDLGAAVKFYLGRDHANAHSAEEDVKATTDLVDAMLAKYPELPRNLDELSASSNRKVSIDSGGVFVKQGNEIRFAKIKDARGQTLADVARLNPGLLQWILDKDFPADTKRLVKEALTQSRTGAKS